MCNHSDLLLHRPPPPCPRRRNTSQTFVSSNDLPFCAVKYSAPLPPLPDHWKCEFGYPRPWDRVATFAFRMAVLISFGHDNLDSVWEICHSEERWAHDKDRLAQRITTTTVVAGLLVGATAAFITTTPPVEELLNYTRRGPYLLLLLSFSITLGSLIVGSTMIFITLKCDPVWFCSTLMATRSKVLCTFVLIAYPFVTVGIATTFAALGFVVASLHPDDLVMNIGSIILLMLPICLLFVFAWTQLPLLRPRDSLLGAEPSILP
ncbi:PGG domain-containing protein [Pleurotus pulmonarius]